MLQYEFVKLYKIGRKTTGTEKNVFEMGLGTSKALMGFDKRYSFFAIPVTVMKKPLSFYVSEAMPIVAILYKENKQGKYDKVVATVKSGLTIDLIPSEIQRRIAPKLFETGRIIGNKLSEGKRE